MPRTNFTKLGIVGTNETSSDIELIVKQYQPIPETERDSLSAVDGMKIYNSDTNTLQGYINGSWDAAILCTMLDLANAGPPPTNATVVYDPAPNTNRMSITRIAAGGASSAFGADVVNTFDLTGSVPVVFSVSCPMPSVLNDGGACGLAIFDSVGFTVIQGISFHFGTGSNGQFKDPNGTPISAANIAYPTTPKYKLQIEVHEDGSATYSDNNGQSGSLSSSGSFTGITSALSTFGDAPATAGGSVELTLNGGSEAMPLPLTDPTAETWCNLTPVVQVPEYKLFEVNPPDLTVSLSNSDRTINVVSDNINDSDYFYSAGWPVSLIPITQENPNGNTFEFEVNQNTTSIGSLLLLVTSQTVLSTQHIMAFSDTSNDKYHMSIDGGLLMTTPIAAGDVVAMQVFDNGAAASDIGFVFAPSGGTPFVLDTFSARAIDKFTFAAARTGGFPEAISNDLSMTFNGKEADYSFSNYRSGSVDYEGDPMPSKVSPYTRVATWYDLTFNVNHNTAGMTAIVSGGGKTLTCTSSTAVMIQARATCSSGIKPNTGVVAAMMGITTADASGTAPEFKLTGLGNSTIEVGHIRIVSDGTDIILSIRIHNTTTDTVIASSTSFSSGDVVSLELDTVALTAKGIYFDGVTVHSTAAVSYDGTGGEAKTLYLPAGGVEDLQIGEFCVLENQNLNTDMNATVKAALTAGAVDVLGNAI